MLKTLGRAAVAVMALGASVAFADVKLQGAGATFPNPLYQKWVVEYQKLHPDVKIDYQSIGSGGGVKNITEKTVDFGASDAPLNRKEIDALGGPTKVVQVPSCAGAVVPAYNLPGITQELKFTGEILADIYLGKITKWNDPRLAEINPGVAFPSQTITPAWRSDGSGTTFVFTNYLFTQSDDYKGTIGAGKQVSWPLGQGGEGNPGVTKVVQQTAGAIGYIELNYAIANKIPFASMKNKSGKFVKASLGSVSAAGEGAVEKMQPPVISADIWNQPGDNAYPISAFTYLIVYSDLNNVKTKEQAEGLVGFIWWATHDGQKLAAALDYAPLSENVQKKVEEALKGVSFGGSAIMASK